MNIEFLTLFGHFRLIICATCYLTDAAHGTHGPCKEDFSSLVHVDTSGIDAGQRLLHSQAFSLMRHTAKQETHKVSQRQTEN